MSMPGVRLSRAALAAVVIGSGAAAGASAAQTATARIAEALHNITVLVRPGRVGYATIWDGNKYVQCRRRPDHAMRCEAAGTLMQPSLRNVLTDDRLNRIAALGWFLDPSFGNYVRTFPASTPAARIAGQIARLLSEAYAADVTDLELKTAWVANVPCPPRAGPSQNLAGSINDAPAMQATAVHACAYGARSQMPRRAGSTAGLIAIYGTRVTAEIERLRINAARDVHAVFSAGIGYVQCMPATPSPALYCEAQSADSWAALASILTPARASLLHQAGYSDPGRAPNYWKYYPFDKYSAAAVADELLTILHDVYGYEGAMKLEISTK